MVIEKAKFELGELTATEKRVVEDCTSEIRDFIRKTGRDAHRIGLKLKAAKEVLGHGRFLGWLGSAFGWSADTAERLMKVAEKFTEIPHAAEFSLTALYLLAGDHVPEDARREAVGRAGAGEIVTAAVAKQIVTKHAATENTASVHKPATRITATRTSVEKPITNGSAQSKNDISTVVRGTGGTAKTSSSPAPLNTTNGANAAPSGTSVALQNIDADLMLLFGAVLPFVARESGPELVPTIKQLVAGWPAERTAKLRVLAGEVHRVMSATLMVLARPPRSGSA